LKNWKGNLFGVYIQDSSVSKMSGCYLNNQRLISHGENIFVFPTHFTSAQGSI